MMRMLGFLFLIVLVVAVVGFFRGWYTVSTVEAGGKTGVTLDFDKDRIGKDTAAAADKLGELSAKAAEKVRRMAEKIGAEQSAIAGRVVQVDGDARTLRITTNGEDVDLKVPPDVVVTRDGTAIGLAELEPGTNVRIILDQKGSTLLVTGIEVMP